MSPAADVSILGGGGPRQKRAAVAADARRRARRTAAAAAPADAEAQRLGHLSNAVYRAVSMAGQ